MGGVNGGGFNHVTANKVKNASLPSTLKCTVCGQHRERDQFSNKQLEAARYKIVQQNASKPQGRRAESVFAVRCRQCVGQVRQELQCVSCGITKDLNEFAKTQRQNVDEHKCNQCMDATLAVEPRDHITAIGRYSDDEDDDDDDYVDDWGNDGRSSFTGITNPWAMDHEGDFATTTAPSVSGRTTSAVASGIGSVASGGIARQTSPRPTQKLTSANVQALNNRIGTPANQNTSAAGDITKGIANMGVSDDNEGAGWSTVAKQKQSDNVKAWGAFSANAAARTQAQQPVAPRGQPFTAWGPGGRKATQYRAPDTESTTSIAASEQFPALVRTKVPPARASKFAKVRPDNRRDDKGKATASPWADQDDNDNGSAW